MPRKLTPPLRPTPDYRLCRQDDVVKWSVSAMWQREEGDSPHVAANLSDRVPLRSDCLSVPEMRAILTLSGARALDEGHHHREVLPVSFHSWAILEFPALR